MADDKKKKISLGGIDNAAEEKGSFMKTLWQLVKFLVVSGLVTIIQLVLANVLPLIFDGVTATLPVFLQGIFDPNVIFDASTKEGIEQVDGTIQNGSVVGGVVTWGYLLPFFLSNLIANIYGFYQNKKTTFKSDAPWYSFAFYIVLMIALILFVCVIAGATPKEASAPLSPRSTGLGFSPLPERLPVWLPALCRWWCSSPWKSLSF